MDTNDEVDWGSEIDSQFIRQASWTEMFRTQIYRRINLLKAKKILDVGCGTGVITREIRKKCSAKITAIDIDPDMIKFAKKRVSNVDFRVENVEELSDKKGSFDIVLFHHAITMTILICGTYNNYHKAKFAQSYIIISKPTSALAR